MTAWRDPGADFRPLELRHVVRTRHLTVAAPDAEAVVVRDDAEFALLQRAEHAGADTRRIDAVHALPLHVGQLVGASIELDDVLRAGVEIDGGLIQAAGPGGVGRQVVRLCARAHARLAADAERRVVEETDGVSGRFAARGSARGRGAGERRARHDHPFQRSASTDAHATPPASATDLSGRGARASSTPRSRRRPGRQRAARRRLSRRD